MKLPELVGVGGLLAAGKDSISDILVNHYGYFHLSTGDAIRSEALRRGLDVNRQVLQQLSNEIRIIHGGGALALDSIAHFRKLQVDQPYLRRLVVSGIRTLGEAQVIRQNDGLLMFAEAPAEIRYARLAERSRGDEVTHNFEEFITFEETELESTSEHAQNINGVRSLSHIIINNSGTRDDLAMLTTAALRDFRTAA